MSLDSIDILGSKAGTMEEYLESKENDIIKFMERTNGVSFSDEQLEILKHKGGLCILASAGSGKTTVLNNLIAKRFQTGEISSADKLLCTTFSKAGADEMSTRLNKLLQSCNISKRVEVKTLHAVFYKLIRDMQYNFNVISEGTRMKYIREAVKDVLNTNSLYAVSDDTLITLDSILSFQVNNLMSDSSIFQSYIYTIRNEISLEQYTRIRTAFVEKKKQNSEIDFDDMQVIVYNIFRHKVYGEQLRNYCRTLWEYIYIDEAQDISKIQFEILKHIISDPNKLVIIGDDDQCIYQWRGADPSIILNICGIYPELTKLTLTTNYRCLSNIVDKAAYGIQFNPIRSEKTMKPFRQGGSVKFCDCGGNDIFEMSKYPYAYITGLVDSGVNPADIAVLCRNNKHLTILANMLFKDGIYCELSNEMKFTTNFYYRQYIKGVIALAGDPYTSTVTKENLWKCCKFLRNKEVAALASIQASYGLRLSDTLGFALSECLGVQCSWENVMNLKGSSAYSFSLGSISSQALEGLVVVYNALTCGDTGQTVRRLLMQFFRVHADIFKQEDSARFAKGLMRYCYTLVEEMGYTNFMNYINRVEQYECGAMATFGGRVKLSTMHGAKGKEWKYVILFADDNVTFPSFEEIRGNKFNNVPDVDIKRMVDENRRLHYVAFTRAKENLTIFAASDNLSIYTIETMGLIDIDKNNDNKIMVYAQHGMDAKLVNLAKEKLFGDKSEYKIDVDISNIKLGSGANSNCDYNGFTDSSQNLNNIGMLSKFSYDE